MSHAWLMRIQITERMMRVGDRERALDELAEIVGIREQAIESHMRLAEAKLARLLQSRATDTGRMQ